MSVMEDLISFDIIENQKENIQSLPQGRSAKALAAQFAPSPFSPIPTPGATRSLNDAIRQEYEVELQGIADADDPLDIFDRYVKWTLNAYPSAQATPESQLRQLLERATKTFQGSPQYKNDVRYLKLWLNYIRFFSDAPRETYAYLSRHGIGDGLALFYEEFAAWLEGAGRWSQAEEIYKLGIEKESRPAERLMRKFSEFQSRFEARPHSADEPTSPALPTVRPALAAKLDPFASSTTTDPQGRRGLSSSSSSKSGRIKMAIFSDAASSASSSRPGSSDVSKGWDSIGTIAERKKENDVEPRAWVGETLKAGKKAPRPKMMVFKDQPSTSARGLVISGKNGKAEKWFADVESVYPDAGNSKNEYCFEELRARSRGWLTTTWSRPSPRRGSVFAGRQKAVESARPNDRLLNTQDASPAVGVGDGDTTGIDIATGTKKLRTKKKKVMEVKGETQTIKAVLDSPVAKTKLRRKKSSDQTMTLHTKAATDDVLDLFNQPLRNIGPIGSRADSDGDTTDYDPEDYTCGVSSVGDNTRSGNFSDTESVYNDEVTNYESEIASNEYTRPESVSPWSDFNTKKHIPDIDTEQIEANAPVSNEKSTHKDLENTEELRTPTEDNVFEGPFGGFSTSSSEENTAPRVPFRTAAQAAQSRLPFMTPIAERTESSLGLPTIKPAKGPSVCHKTPSKSDFGARSFDCTTQKLQDLTLYEEPVVLDTQLNPHDETVRQLIMKQAALASSDLYHDERLKTFGKGAEIRKYIKSLQKTSRASADKSLHLAPILQFPGAPHITYTIRRELGKGAYASVYLGCVADGADENASSLLAIKSESPPSAWEFYALSTLHDRLGATRPERLSSFTKPISFHHFADEVYLLESYHDQGTLLDLVNLVRSEPSLGGSGGSLSGSFGLDEIVAMFFSVELLRSVIAMHEHGIIHGDLKADNCLVRLENCSSDLWGAHYDPSGSEQWSSKGLTLVDFGRSIDMKAFREDVTFLADWKTGQDDCVEMRELRPWTYQVDYWGTAGILHVMLFGKWIEDVASARERSSHHGTNHDTDDYSEKTMFVGKAGLQKRKLKEGLKRYWQTDLWADVFDVLMNPTSWVTGEDNGKLPVTRRLAEVTDALEGYLIENSERKGLRAQLRRIEECIREKRRRE